MGIPFSDISPKNPHPRIYLLCKKHTN